VTRHQGALDWLNQEKVQFDRHILHLAIDQLQPGDGVIGNLPVPMVADLTAMGVRYWHLSFDVPLELRGVELSADQLRKLGIQLRAYRVEPD
jgi:CRISPR-associated protein Csx16